MDLDRIKGKVKETVGTATDNDRMRRDGKTEQAAGTAKDKLRGAVDAVKDTLTKH